MTSNRGYLASALVTAAAVLGSFGDLGGRRDYSDGVTYSKPSKPRWEPDKRIKGRARSGHGKGHRRRYLSGKPAFRTL